MIRDEFAKTAIFHFASASVSSQGIRSLLSVPLGFTVVGQAAEIKAGLPLIKELQPDLILCGIRPGSFTPQEVVSGLSQLSLSIPVLVLTEHADGAEVRDLIRAGVKGYLLTEETTPNQLASAIQAVRQGLTVFGPTIQRIAAEAMPQETSRQLLGIERLTERERQILELIVSGMGNREIASALSLSLRTVQLHASHLFEKLGARSRLEVAVRGLQSDLPWPQKPAEGIVAPDEAPVTPMMGNAIPLSAFGRLTREQSVSATGMNSRTLNLHKPARR